MIKWLSDTDGRRAGAFIALLGAAFVFTAYAAVVLYIVRGAIGLVFWLGLAAHMQIAIITTGFIALFVKRTVTISKEGLIVNDISNEAIAAVATAISNVSKDPAVPPS